MKKIETCLEMYNGDNVNRNFLKGRIILNMGQCKGQIGRILGFYKATEDNVHHTNRRYFNVEILSTGNVTNWWLDVSKGENKNLLLLDDIDDKYINDLLDKTKK